MRVQMHQAHMGQFFALLKDVSMLDDDLVTELNELRQSAVREIASKFSSSAIEFKPDVDLIALSLFYVTVLEGMLEEIRYGATEDQLYDTADTSLIVLQEYLKG